MAEGILIPADVELSKAQAQVNSFIAEANRKEINFNVKPLPLGRVSADISEISKSLDAANARVIAFGLSASVIAGVVTQFKSLVSESINVERILTDVNSILNASPDNLKKFSQGLFDVARQTGATFSQVGKVATEFARQGLSAQETLTRTRDTQILSRLSGLPAAQAQTGLTAAVNSFSETGITTSEIVNKLAQVDASFAVSSRDLIEGLSRSASTAKDASVSFDELLGIITALQQRTGRGGEIIGNSLKSVFSRVERPANQNLLEDVGVQTKDQNGAQLSTVAILGNLANSYDKLGQSQRQQIESQIAGLFQINLLKAGLKDLASQNSITAQATLVSAQATDEATRRNQLLNQTTSARLGQTANTAVEFAGNVGGAIVKPAVDSAANIVQPILSSINSLVTGNSVFGEIGKNISTTILEAIGSTLAGPGIITITNVLGRLLAKISQDTVKAIGIAGGAVGSDERRATISTALTNPQGQNVEVVRALQQGLISVDQAELQILSNAQKVTQQYLEQSAAVALLATRLAEVKALTINDAGLLTVAGASIARGKTAASGYIPEEIAFTEKSQALKGGYVPGEVKQMNIPGKGQVFYNTAETIRHFPGFEQPAILPKAGSKAGINYQKHFLQKFGFDPYAAEGLIPDFTDYFNRGATDGRADQGQKFIQEILRRKQGVNPLGTTYENISKPGQLGASFRFGAEGFTPDMLQSVVSQLGILGKSGLGMDARNKGQIKAAIKIGQITGQTPESVLMNPEFQNNFRQFVPNLAELDNFNYAAPTGGLYQTPEYKAAQLLDKGQYADQLQKISQVLGYKPNIKFGDLTHNGEERLGSYTGTLSEGERAGEYVNTTTLNNKFVKGGLPDQYQEHFGQTLFHELGHNIHLDLAKNNPELFDQLGVAINQDQRKNGGALGSPFGLRNQYPTEQLPLEIFADLFGHAARGNRKIPIGGTDKFRDLRDLETYKFGRQSGLIPFEVAAGFIPHYAASMTDAVNREYGALAGMGYDPQKAHQSIRFSPTTAETPNGGVYNLLQERHLNDGIDNAKAAGYVPAMKGIPNFIGPTTYTQSFVSPTTTTNPNGSQPAQNSPESVIGQEQLRILQQIARTLVQGKPAEQAQALQEFAKTAKDGKVVQQESAKIITQAIQESQVEQGVSAKDARSLTREQIAPNLQAIINQSQRYAPVSDTRIQSNNFSQINEALERAKFTENYLSAVGPRPEDTRGSIRKTLFPRGEDVDRDRFSRLLDLNPQRAIELTDPTFSGNRDIGRFALAREGIGSALNNSPLGSIGRGLGRGGFGLQIGAELAGTTAKNLLGENTALGQFAGEAGNTIGLASAIAGINPIAGAAFGIGKLGFDAASSFSPQNLRILDATRKQQTVGTEAQKTVDTIGTFQQSSNSLNDALQQNVSPAVLQRFQQRQLEAFTQLPSSVGLQLAAASPKDQQKVLEDEAAKAAQRKKEADTQLEIATGDKFGLANQSRVFNGEGLFQTNKQFTEQLSGTARALQGIAKPEDLATEQSRTAFLQKQGFSPTEKRTVQTGENESTEIEVVSASFKKLAAELAKAAPSPELVSSLKEYQANIQNASRVQNEVFRAQTELARRTQIYSSQLSTAGQVFASAQGTKNTIQSNRTQTDQALQRSTFDSVLSTQAKRFGISDDDQNELRTRFQLGQINTTTANEARKSNQDDQIGVQELLANAINSIAGKGIDPRTGKAAFEFTKNPSGNEEITGANENAKEDIRNQIEASRFARELITQQQGATGFNPNEGGSVQQTNLVTQQLTSALKTFQTEAAKQNPATLGESNAAIVSIQKLLDSRAVNANNINDQRRTNVNDTLNNFITQRIDSEFRRNSTTAGGFEGLLQGTNRGQGDIVSLGTARAGLAAFANNSQFVDPTGNLQGQIRGSLNARAIDTVANLTGDRQISKETAATLSADNASSIRETLRQALNANFGFRPDSQVSVQTKDQNDFSQLDARRRELETRIQTEQNPDQKIALKDQLTGLDSALKGIVDRVAQDITKGGDKNVDPSVGRNFASAFLRSNTIGSDQIAGRFNIEGGQSRVDPRLLTNPTRIGQEQLAALQDLTNKALTTDAQGNYTQQVVQAISGLKNAQANVAQSLQIGQVNTQATKVGGELNQVTGQRELAVKGLNQAFQGSDFTQIANRAFGVTTGAAEIGSQIATQNPEAQFSDLAQKFAEKIASNPTDSTNRELIRKSGAEGLSQEDTIAKIKQQLVTGGTPEQAKAGAGALNNIATANTQIATLTTSFKSLNDQVKELQQTFNQGKDKTTVEDRSRQLSTITDPTKRAAAIEAFNKLDKSQGDDSIKTKEGIKALFPTLSGTDLSSISQKLTTPVAADQYTVQQPKGPVQAPAGAGALNLNKVQPNTSPDFGIKDPYDLALAQSSGLLPKASLANTPPAAIPNALTALEASNKSIVEGGDNDKTYRQGADFNSVPNSFSARANAQLPGIFNGTLNSAPSDFGLNSGIPKSENPFGFLQNLTQPTPSFNSSPYSASQDVEQNVPIKPPTLEAKEVTVNTTQPAQTTNNNQTPQIGQTQAQAQTGTGQSVSVQVSVGAPNVEITQEASDNKTTDTNALKEAINVALQDPKYKDSLAIATKIAIQAAFRNGGKEPPTTLVNEGGTATA